MFSPASSKEVNLKALNKNIRLLAKEYLRESRILEEVKNNATKTFSGHSARDILAKKLLSETLHTSQGTTGFSAWMFFFLNHPIMIKFVQIFSGITFIVLLIKYSTSTIEFLVDIWYVISGVKPNIKTRFDQVINERWQKKIDRQQETNKKLDIPITQTGNKIDQAFNPEKIIRSTKHLILKTTIETF